MSMLSTFSFSATFTPLLHFLEQDAAVPLRTHADFLRSQLRIGVPACFAYTSNILAIPRMCFASYTRWQSAMARSILS